MSDIHPAGFHPRDSMFLENKTLKELQDLARKYGVTPVTGLKKADLVSRIKKLIESQSQTLLDFESSSTAKSASAKGNVKSDTTRIEVPAKSKGKPRKTKKVEPVKVELNSDDVFPTFLEERTSESKKADIFPTFLDEKPSKPGRGRKPKTASDIIDPFPEFKDEIVQERKDDGKKSSRGRPAKTPKPTEVSSPVSTPETTEVAKTPQSKTDGVSALRDYRSPEVPKPEPRPQHRHHHQRTERVESTDKETRQADFRDATSPGGRKDGKNKKHLVHDALPESNAPTLIERVREIEPLLGGYLINEGTLEILPDGYGFLRSVNYNFSASPDDIYVSPSQIKRFCLKQGDTVVGIIRPPKVGERYFALLRVEGVNGEIPLNMDSRRDFEDLLPVYPDQRYKMETDPSNYTTRIIDLFSPIGKGQRGLIVAQPKTGKTTILREIANAVSSNNPDTKILILLVDERPEEVTEMERTVLNAEVLASTFDQKPENHKGLAEIVFEKAKRLVESGHDVLLLMDSITRLARAYNIASNSGRTMTGGVDSEALKIPRQLFSSARNIEGGGSLTIIATALVDTGSRMDDVIFEEFKGTGNMEIVLDRRISDRRIYPAIDIYKSGTRKEELFVSDEEREKVVLLRRYLTSMNPMEAVEFVLDKMKGTRNNREFLISMNQ
jgi:transcription termination factor Rho